MKKLYIHINILKNVKLNIIVLDKYTYKKWIKNKKFLKFFL